MNLKLRKYRKENCDQSEPDNGSPNFERKKSTALSPWCKQKKHHTSDFAENQINTSSDNQNLCDKNAINENPSLTDGILSWSINEFRPITYDDQD